LALTSCVAVGHDAFNSAETDGVRDIREAYQANTCSKLWLHFDSIVATKFFVFRDDY